MKSIMLKLATLTGLLVAMYLPSAAQSEDPAEFYKRMRTLNGQALSTMSQLGVDISDRTVSGRQPAPVPQPPAPPNWFSNTKDLAFSDHLDTPLPPAQKYVEPGPDGVITHAYPGWEGTTPEEFLKQLENLPGGHRDPSGHEVDDAQENEAPQVPANDAEAFDVSSTNGTAWSDSSSAFDNSDNWSSDMFSGGSADEFDDPAPSLPEGSFSVASDPGGDDPQSF